jgi:hypothetical protein
VISLVPLHRNMYVSHRDNVLSPSGLGKGVIEAFLVEREKITTKDGSIVMNSAPISLLFKESLASFQEERDKAIAKAERKKMMREGDLQSILFSHPNEIPLYDPKRTPPRLFFAKIAVEDGMSLIEDRMDKEVVIYRERPFTNEDDIVSGLQITHISPRTGKVLKIREYEGEARETFFGVPIINDPRLPYHSDEDSINLSYEGSITTAACVREGKVQHASTVLPFDKNTSIFHVGRKPYSVIFNATRYYVSYLIRSLEGEESYFFLLKKKDKYSFFLHTPLVVGGEFFFVSFEEVEASSEIVHGLSGKIVKDNMAGEVTVVSGEDCSIVIVTDIESEVYRVELTK